MHKNFSIFSEKEIYLNINRVIRLLDDKMRKKLLIFTVFALVSFSLSIVIVSLNEPISQNQTEEQKVYVGTTYCGDSVAEGKLLIDRVKKYTNLFVLGSGTLQRDFKSVDDLGDYAVSSGLFFLPYFGAYVEPTFSNWYSSAKQRWGDHLIGVYYGDEPGGKMLDAYVEFEDPQTGNSITKTTYGDLVIKMNNNVVIHYEINGGIIHLSEPTVDKDISSYSTFYPNGTITGQHSNQSSFQSYQDLINLKPFKDNEEVAQRFVDNNQKQIIPLNHNSSKIFTTDYALYWWDYLSGYDVVLSQIGWNISVNQQIALVRGAANLQNKEWGIVITWKYNHSPFLDSGENIFSQMQIAYEAGAKYFVLFNYYDENSNSYGTLTNEHFQALEDFWNKIVKNPKIINGATKADSVLILPKNYGWGARWEQDKVWGIFQADEQTKQIWLLMQQVLKDHESKLDIIFNDTRFPVNGYQYVYTSNIQD
jgi:hypothetical protein